MIVPETDHLDIDESIWIVVDFPNEVHVIPENDVIDHELEWQCWCNPKQLNSEQVEMNGERPLYSHNRCMDVVQ
jgi:hypothetical protein